MIPYVGVYTSDQAARDAAKKLDDAGFEDFEALLASEIAGVGGPGPQASQPTYSEPASEPAPQPSADGPAGDGEAGAAPGEAGGVEAAPPAPAPAPTPTRGAGDTDAEIAAMVQSAVERGLIRSGNAAQCVRLLQEGKSIVAVDAPFETGELATEILSAEGEMLEPALDSDPSPFSDFFGWPTLAKFESSTKLTDSSWTFSSMFGMGVLGGGASPLSSAIGLGTLTKKQAGWKSSLGLPLLIDNAAPLSSMFGMKTLTSHKEGIWERSLGFEMLSDNPAPLSSMFGIPTLTKEKDRGGADKN